MDKEQLNEIRERWKPYGLNILMVDEISTKGTVVFYITVPEEIEGAPEEVNRTKGKNLALLFKQYLIEYGIICRGKSKIDVKFSVYNPNTKVCDNNFIT
jgi:hypothetical protein